MKTSLKLTAFLAFAFALTGLVRAADIDGKWKVEFDSQVGKQKYTYELKADGEKLTGKISAERELGNTTAEVKDGKIVKDEVSFSETIKIQDQEITITYKGKLAGDELKLHRKVGDGLAEYDIVAKREKTEKK
jgi:hypothetical protein